MPDSLMSQLVNEAKVIAPGTINRKQQFVTKRKAANAAIVLVFLGITVSALLMFFSNRNTAFFPAYDSPLDIPIQLAGNFGEVRNGHWHSGLDIRTNGKENLPVKSVAGGWVSRVTISADGYGNAIYITHNNNRTSLYAHLNSFMEPIGEYVASVQQAKEQWSQDIRLPIGKFKVKKGMIIGQSGNTGFSEGPHLHFEWRNTKTGNRINPQLEVLKVRDKLPPVIEDVYWYNREAGSNPYLPQKLYSLASLTRNTENLAKTQLVPSRVISLGITVVDKISSSPFNMGVYQVKVLVDGSCVYNVTMDSLTAISSRNVNSSIDYAEWQNSANCILLLSPWKNAIYETSQVSGNGLIDLGDGKVHHVKIETKDIAGNTSSYDFRLKSNNKKQVQQLPSPNFLSGRKTSIKNENAIVDLPAGSFYNDVYFSISEKPPSDKKEISAVIGLSQPNVPLQDSLTLRIKCRRQLSTDEKKHAVLLIQNGAENLVHLGSWQGNWFAARIGNLGKARIIIDSIPPTIKLLGWKNRQQFNTGDLVKMVIKDNISVTGNIRAELDGRWIPLAQKDNVFSFRINNKTRVSNPNPGRAISINQHVLMIRVSDVAGNISRNVFRFQY
ncbi:M23 family metallopeptidase [Flavitalea sp.]|nr:M23 family metallopeptidase [Flavitalea sp.]